MGTRVGCIPADEPGPVSRGAVVTGNTLRGTHMGYGFVIGGVTDWTATDNRDLSEHLQPPFPLDCFGDLVDAPAGFQLSPDFAAGDFQPEFLPSTLGFTVGWWPNQAVTDEECLSELLGAAEVDAIRMGERGQVWPALEAAASSRPMYTCQGVYEPPVFAPDAGDVAIAVSACEPYCATVEMINTSEVAVDLSGVQFILESFFVECAGLPALLEPQESTTCTIDDWVADGFQVLWFGGLPPHWRGWGFNYPIE